MPSSREKITLATSNRAPEIHRPRNKALAFPRCFQALPMNKRPRQNVVESHNPRVWMASSPSTHVSRQILRIQVVLGDSRTERRSTQIRMESETKISFQVSGRAWVTMKWKSRDAACIEE